MKLHYKPGACAMASHIILNELGVSFDLDKTDTDARETEAGEDFRKISPNGYVPALITDNGDIITENPAVLQYLADQSPDAGLAPASGTLARTRLQEALNFLSSELHKSFGPFFSGVELDDAARKKAEAGVGRLGGWAGPRTPADGALPDFGGRIERPAYAFVVLNWAGFVGVSLDALPKTQAYVARIAARPASIKAMIAEGLMEQAA